ncbi:hypothetical protein NDU88_011574 [Pleurodeles waltl]|uniref:Uncharacterized protein n=1 Tax=Pleurodeles waltl TaxID=8319 RepID=A0AAV7S4M8_PLEWA|nr:hypothetical protein NDU88_011574 [Pleurodeles waltl]
MCNRKCEWKKCDLVRVKYPRVMIERKRCVGFCPSCVRATGQRNVECGQKNVGSGFGLWQLRQGMDADDRRGKLYRCNLE